MSELAVPTLLRFWMKTRFDPDTNCIEWTASRNERGGYGRFRLNGRLEVAHRVGYILAGGHIPEGMTLDHLCRNTRCVNPLHLEPVTVAENIQRGTQGWQQRAKTHCPQGHPYDERNTYIGKRGDRMCRTCGRDRMRRQRAGE
jgi:hypothetical protein